jgi:DNA-binding IscR family transcriptional regulator
MNARMHSIAAVIAVARHQRRTGGYVQIRPIALALGGNRRSHEAAIQRLVKAGILITLRGRSGGFRLKRAPDKLTLSQIAKAVDNAERPEDDAIAEIAVAQRVLNDADDALLAALATTTVAEAVIAADERIAGGSFDITAEALEKSKTV